MAGSGLKLVGGSDYQPVVASPELKPYSNDMAAAKVDLTSFSLWGWSVVNAFQDVASRIEGDITAEACWNSSARRRTRRVLNAPKGVDFSKRSTARATPERSTPTPERWTSTADGHRP